MEVVRLLARADMPLDHGKLSLEQALALAAPARWIYFFD